MRRRRTGSISVTKTGFRPQAWVDGKRISLGVYETREEAEAMLDAARRAAKEERIVDGVTLRTWAGRALDRRERQGLRAVKRERSRWKIHVDGDELADLPVRDIQRKDVQRWLDRRLGARTQGARAKRGRTVSRQTVQNALTLLRSVLEDAVARGVAETNAAESVHLPRARGRTVEPWTYLLPEEQARLLSVVSEPARPAVAFAIATGLRQGEQWALELADVHLEAEAPFVTVRFGAPGMPTKSGKPRRVDLLPSGVDAVRAQLDVLAAMEARAKRKRRGPSNPHRLLFPSLRGTRRQPGAPTGWEAWVVAAGLGRPLRWHDLRHTCASSLVAGWWGRAWTLLEVRAQLGHSTVTITERYAHLAGTVTEDAARATRESTRSALAGLGKGRKSLSHFRDLNSRPTVYEGDGELNNSAVQGLRRARACALKAAEALAAGGAGAARDAVTHLGGVVDELDAVLERGGLRLVAGGRL
jgi:integrase